MTVSWSGKTAIVTGNGLGGDQVQLTDFAPIVRATLQV